MVSIVKFSSKCAFHPSYAITTAPLLASAVAFAVEGLEFDACRNFLILDNDTCSYDFVFDRN